MITSLTQEQLDKIPQYVEKWTALGLTTTPRTLADAQIDFMGFQKLIMKMDPPAPVVLYDSPSKCWNAVNVVKNLTGLTNDNVVEKVTNALKTHDSKTNEPFVWPYFDCQYWASWFSFYEFMKNELGIEFNNLKEYEAFKACQPYGMVFPLNELCIVCQPPTVLKKNANGLHCEDGPAVSYNGDNEIYALNGVIMDKKYILTPAQEISSQDILKETNAEVRRELLRKVGIERMLNDLPHKLLDKVGEYELFSISLSAEVPDARYLKMTNPSIGVFHMEGVDPQVDTVEKALKWRNENLFINAEILT